MNKVTLIYRNNGELEMKSKTFKNQAELTKFRDTYKHSIIAYHLLENGNVYNA